MSENPIEKSPQLFARLGGALYLIIIALGLYGELFIRDRVITSGDAAVTAANLRAMESGQMTGQTEATDRPRQLEAVSAIHIAIHNNVVYDVLPMTCSAVRALPCR